MDKPYNFIIPDVEHYDWVLEELPEEVDTSGVFTSEDGTTTFKTEDGQDFRTEQ